MNKLKAKKIKRHMLKSYEFWQIDEKFLVVSPDKKLFLQEGLESLPDSESGYLACCASCIASANVGHGRQTDA